MSISASVVFSALALFVAGLTAWLTLLRRGTVKMTQPATIYFGWDWSEGRQPSFKIYLRSLLYATAKRGRVIEGMYVRLSRAETRYSFNIWVYGEKDLFRGSGLFVPETGFSANHHFMLPANAPPFTFVPGDYLVEVYATMVGEQAPRRLYSIPLVATHEQALALTDVAHGLHFDWVPEAGKYHAHVLTKPKPDPLELWRGLPNFEG